MRTLVPRCSPPADRRTNDTYLDVLFRPEVLLQAGGSLAPGLPMPATAALDHAGVSRFIREGLPAEAPPMFGLHPNAELGYLTATGDGLLKTLLTTSAAAADVGPAVPPPAAAAATGKPDASAPAGGVRGVLNDLLERLPEDLPLLDIEARAEPLLRGPTAPFVLVCMQEVGRMNELLQEVRRSLGELRKGLDGALNMSEAMEDLAGSLAINQVPGRNPLAKTSWERLAWPSRKPLSSWFLDLLRRVEQLRRWSAGNIVTPTSVWLPGLFNAMAFLTATCQVAARETGQPLDAMTIQTHVTTYAGPEAVPAGAKPPRGTFVHGLRMEGARWASPAELDEEPTVLSDGTAVGGRLAESRLKQVRGRERVWRADGERGGGYAPAAPARRLCAV